MLRSALVVTSLLLYSSCVTGGPAGKAAADAQKPQKPTAFTPMLSAVVLQYSPTFVSDRVELRQVGLWVDGKPLKDSTQPLTPGVHEIQVAAQFAPVNGVEPVGFAQAFSVKLPRAAHARLTLNVVEKPGVEFNKSLDVSASLDIVQDPEVLKQQSVSLEEVDEAITFHPEIGPSQALQRQGESYFNVIRTCVSKEGRIISQTLLTPVNPIFDAAVLSTQRLVKFSPKRHFCFSRPHMYIHS